MKIVEPKEFTIKLSQCGVDTCRCSYKTLKDKDALFLALRVNNIMFNDFIDKEHTRLFHYHLACKLLKDVLKEDFDIKDIGKDIKNSDSFMNKWILRKNKVSQISKKFVKKQEVKK